MLTSQTSSSSATSLTPSKNERPKRFKSELPEKFKESCVLSRKVLVEEPVIVIITSLCEVIEFRNVEVINYFNFKCHIESELAKETINAEDVDLGVFFRDSGVIIYVLQVNSVLFAIERLSSQLRLLKTLTKVKSFKYKLDELTNMTSVQVTFENNKQLITSFDDNDLEDLMRNAASTEFLSFFECVSQKMEAARCHLDNITKDIEKMDLSLHGNLKMLPNLMLADVSQKIFLTAETNFSSLNYLPKIKDPNEKCPLVRYGSAWTRNVNDKIVIGIPVVCISKR